MLKEIKELLRELEGTSIEELEIETKDFKVKVRFSRGAVQPVVAAAPQEMSETTEEVKETESPSKDYYVVESPMVGTFYRAPAPGAEPFVKEGDFVEKGQTLCIIEALKVMNEIESEVSGIVRKILVENGQPVEYGQPLFYIETE